MWRPRDRERFYGSYDPEHEMPDAGRNPGDRWESDAYRHNARDTRFAYRLDPNRFENRFEGRRDIDREMQTRWDRDARDLNRDRDWDRDVGRGGGYGLDRGGWDRDREFGRGSFRENYTREFHGGGGGYGGGFTGRYGGGYDYDRDRGGRNFSSGPDLDRWGADRGSDHDRWNRDRWDRDRWDRDHWRR